MAWTGLFGRAEAYEASIETVREILAERREQGPEREQEQGGDGSERSAGGGDPGGDSAGPGADPSPARVVADADVLAADLLVGGNSREALDHVRAHSWVVLVASDPLLDDAEAVVAALADEALAADWREAIEGERERVGQPPGDHPALASALGGGAMHVLTLDEGLQSAGAGAAIRAHVETSLKSPAAFARLFNPEKLYPAVADGEYPGPDRDPRG